MINGINHITISVKNLEESFTFYKDVLNFKPIMKSSFSAYLSINDLWIAIQEESNLTQSNNTYAHIALNIDKANYKSIITLLKSKNVIEWKSNDTEGDSFYFLDPSGNKLEIHYSTLENRINYGKENWKNVQWYI